MARCPAGHESEAGDYCDTCGLVIGGESAGSAGGASGTSFASASPTAAAAAPATGTSAGGASCPVCQAERNGRFCEECGYDFDLAEALPEVTQVPCVLPVNPELSAAGSTESGAGGEGGGQSGESGVSGEGEQGGQGGQSGYGGQSGHGGQSQGVDLDAELARAEAELARTVSGGSEPSSSTETPSASGTATAALAPGFSSGEIVLVVDADRAYYDAQIERGDIIESEFPFPKYPHERRFTFADGPVRIGRASASRGLSPEIDLTGPPLDPAVSHLHAQLLRHDEGWVVVDLDSANGTRLNDAAEPLEAETEIPVKQGDRIHLGVWTTITVQ